MKIALLAVAAAGFALTAAAAQTPSAGLNAADANATQRQCFRMSQIRSTRVADDRTLYVKAAGNDVYRLGMTGACLSGAQFSDPLVMETAGGSDVVCRPLDLDVKVRSSIGGLTPCIIGTMSKLSPAEVAALPPKHKP